MEAPDGSAFIEGVCGDSMEIYLKISDACRICANLPTEYALKFPLNTG